MVTIRINHYHPITGRRTRTRYEVIWDKTQEILAETFCFADAKAVAKVTRQFHETPLAAAA